MFDVQVDWNENIVNKLFKNNPLFIVCLDTHTSGVKSSSSGTNMHTIINKDEKYNPWIEQSFIPTNHSFVDRVQEVTFPSQQACRRSNIL